MSVNTEKLGPKILANLPLQMLLSFNVTLFPFWMVTCLIMLHERFNCLQTIYQVVIVTVLCTVGILEAVRLFLGYSGNLEENIPDLAGFWMVSVLIQLPLQCLLLLNPSLKFDIVQLTLQIMMIAFLVAELIVSYFVLRRIAAYQATQFQLKHADKNE